MRSKSYACFAVLFVSSFASSQQWRVVNTIPNHVDAYSPVFWAVIWRRLTSLTRLQALP